MYEVEYYTRPNGDKPVADWLDVLKKTNIGLWHLVRAKLQKLSEVGLKLLGTNMLKTVKDTDTLYELRANQARVCLHHEVMERRFVLLHGFLKKRRKETGQIEVCCQLLDEYLANR